jgi:hypothetical protein
MALDTTKMTTTFANLVAQLPVACIFSGNSFSALQTELNAEKLLEEYGGLDTYVFSLMVASNALATFPTPKQQITVAGTVYRVMAVVTLPGGVSRRIDVEARFQ